MADARSRSPPGAADDIIGFFDPHFHIWDLSDGTTTGHDAAILPKPRGVERYDRAQYEAEFEELPRKLRHEGGVFLEAVSVCHVGMSGPAYSEKCLAEARFAGEDLTGGGYVLVPTCALEQPDAKEVLTELAKEPRTRGIRQILNRAPDWPRNGSLPELLDSEAWRAGFAALRDVGFSFDLQLNPNQFAKAAAFLEGHPDTTVIVNHLGCPTPADLEGEVFWPGMEALARLPNTFIKLSMLCYPPPKDWDEDATTVEAIHRVIGLFGARRCMFASNYPVDMKDGWPAKRLFSAFLRLAERYSAEEQRDLFGGSARRAYRCP